MKQKKDKTTTRKEKEPRFYNSKVNRMYLLTLSKLPSDQNSCTEAFSVEHELEESEGDWNVGKRVQGATTDLAKLSFGFLFCGLSLEGWRAEADIPSSYWLVQLTLMAAQGEEMLVQTATIP